MWIMWAVFLCSRMTMNYVLLLLRNRKKLMNVWKNFISVVKHLTVLGKYVKTTDVIYTWRDVGENS